MEERMSPDKAADVEGHPVLDAVVPVQDPLDRLESVFFLRLGEEPDMTEVDPEQWHIRAPGQLGAAQDGAVAAQHENELAADRRLLRVGQVNSHRQGAAEELGTRLIDHDIDSGGRQVADDLVPQVDRFESARV